MHLLKSHATTAASSYRGTVNSIYHESASAAFHPSLAIDSPLVTLHCTLQAALRATGQLPFQLAMVTPLSTLSSAEARD